YWHLQYFYSHGPDGREYTNASTTTTTSVTNAQLKALIDQGVADALAAQNQIKFATCTLLGSALTWWNSHVKTVGLDVAYAMTWTNLKKKMANKYCPRGEIKKLEVELWNLKVKCTDVIWTLPLEMSLGSTLKACRFLTCPVPLWLLAVLAFAVLLQSRARWP
nr:reverse transcriptase domain-containing protein [Tanacetum cinerariifolium]